MTMRSDIENTHSRDTNSNYQEIPLDTNIEKTLSKYQSSNGGTKWNSFIQSELKDLKTYRFWRAALTEFYASVWLVVFLLGASCHRSDQQPPSPVFTALTIAFTVNMMVLTTFGLSGAQVNPAITVMLTATGRNTVSRGVVYILMQCFGGACAILILRCLLPESLTDNLNVLEPAKDVTVLQAFSIEVLLGIVIGFATLSMLEKRRTDFWGSFPNGFGIMMASNYLFVSGVTPVCMNPTFSIGPMLVLWNSENQWIYVFGPTIGLLLGGVTFDMFFSEDIADRWDKKFFQVKDDCLIDTADQNGRLECLGEFQDAAGFHTREVLIHDNDTETS